jgi:lysozyme family protein
MAKHTLEELRSEYNSLLQTCEIRADKLTEVQDICDTILANKPRYEAIATATSVPWFMVAAIHSLEGGLNFPMAKKASLIRPIRPFEESATDALMLAVTRTDSPALSVARFRSRELGLHTPYLWSSSNHYTKGKFVRDGVFDPDAVSKHNAAALELSPACVLLWIGAINQEAGTSARF